MSKTQQMGILKGKLELDLLSDPRDTSPSFHYAHNEWARENIRPMKPNILNFEVTFYKYKIFILILGKDLVKHSVAFSLVLLQ